MLSLFCKSDFTICCCKRVLKFLSIFKEAAKSFKGKAELLETKESHVQLTAQHAQLTTQVAQLTAQVTQLIQTIEQGQAMPAVAHYTPPPSVCSNAHQTSPAVDPVNPSPTSGRPPFESLPQ